MQEINRMYNADNPYQGDYPRVLCVCSAGLLRSPTTAVILSQEPYNFNTRAVGVDAGHALIPLDKVQVVWADYIVCVEPRVARAVEFFIGKEFPDGDPTMVKFHKDKIITLEIPDAYGYRDPILVQIIREQLSKIEF